MNTTKLLVFIFAIITSLAFQSETCDQRILKENARKELGEYKYDLSKLTKITYKNKPQLKETEVVLFLGEKYKLIFNTEALSKPIIVNLYNKDKDSKKRKLLFSSKDLPPDKKIFSFEYSFARRIYIDYEIPADSTNQNLSGCVFFMLGYK
ncbi:MAG: hypothetical protein QXO21_05615 [Candidatus Anstonellales archaeon]|nr:MAG: hypothetical protein KatS3mg027_1212 [Bacteroidia bacterium]